MKDKKVSVVGRVQLTFYILFPYLAIILDINKLKMQTNHVEKIWNMEFSILQKIGRLQYNFVALSIQVFDTGINKLNLIYCFAAETQYYFNIYINKS